jgi:hypothetical protein
MERNHILVIAGALVVIAFIGFQMFSGGDLDEGMPLSRARNAAERGGAGGDDDGDVAGGRYAEDGRGGGESGRGRSGSTGLGSGRNESGSRREGGSGSRLGQTALAGRGERGGAAVGSGGRAGGHGSGSAVFDRGGSRQIEGGAPHRSDVVEYLASQPSTNGRAHNADSEEKDDDVALELKRPEDADSAGVKKGVEAPDASDEGLTFTEGSVLAFPDGGNISGEAGTISFEIEPNWNGNDETNNSLVTLRGEHDWSNRIELVKNGRYLRFILSDNVGREADISVPIDAWTPGETHDVEATWGDQKTALFIDGVKVGQNTYTEFVRPDAPLYIGSDHRGSTYSGLNGTLRNFKVKNASNLSSG